MRWNEGIGLVLMAIGILGAVTSIVWVGVELARGRALTRAVMLRVLAAFVFSFGVMVGLLLPNEARSIGDFGLTVSVSRPLVVRVAIGGSGAIIALVLLVIAAPPSKR